MIQDARVLQTEFIPDDVVHRDTEVNAITRALEPITRGEPGETTFLRGPSGVGKTCISKFVLERLRENVIDVNTHSVNCWESHTRFAVLHDVLAGIDKTLDIHRQSTPTDALINRLQEYSGPQYVVVLDEVDQLQDTDALYELLRLRALTLILIANSKQALFSQLDSRVESRLKTVTSVTFNAYSNDALVSILEDRVKWGLRDDAISQSQLEMIADAAGGDARVAIGILRGAARQAMQTNADAISDDHIKDTVPVAQAEIKRKNVERLTDDQRIIYDIVAEEGEINPGELYRRYREQAEDPKTDRMVRNYLDKLRHYNLIVADGENRGRTYRVVS